MLQSIVYSELLGVFTQPALYIDADRDKGGFVFQLWPLSSVYCDSSRVDGKIDMVYRHFELSVEQLVNEYGEENLSDNIKRIAQTDPSKKYKLIHAIYPRKGGKQGKQSLNIWLGAFHYRPRLMSIMRY